MDRLTLVDDAFLRIESRRQPLHIGMLLLFERPPGAGPEFIAKLAERLRSSTHAAAPFNRCLVRRRGLHYWKEDDEFDLAHHFVHTSLPQPGRIRELLAMVSRVHGGHLDRAYPLWRAYLIEGIEDGRFALYLKIHHSVVDGVSALRALMASMAATAEESILLPPPWEVVSEKDGAKALPVHTSAAGGLSALRAIADEGVKSLRPLLRELRNSFDQFRAGNPDMVVGGQAPRTIFNKKVSATRRFAAQSYATSRIRAVSKAVGASTNDVVLAMCGGALRRYLGELGELPERSLIAAVPLSTRRDDDPDFGNAVSFTLATLATDFEDPLERLRQIKRAMDINKERQRRLSPGQMGAYAALAMMPGAMRAVLGFGKEDALASLCISNIPGPRGPMYWQGAKLAGLYPASLVTDHGTLNITLCSGVETVDFGIIACRKTVPHVQRLLDHLEAELAALEAAIR